MVTSRGGIISAATGAILDPLAIKLLLVRHRGVDLERRPYLESVPLWLTGTIIGRDLLILIGMVVIHTTVGKSPYGREFRGRSQRCCKCHRGLDSLEMGASVLAVMIRGAAICNGYFGSVLCVGRRAPVERASSASPKAKG